MTDEERWKKFSEGTKVRVKATGLVGRVLRVDCDARFNGECRHTIGYEGGEVAYPGWKLEEVNEE
jgi:hypothetical protein